MNSKACFSMTLEVVFNREGSDSKGEFGIRLVKFSLTSLIYSNSLSFGLGESLLLGLLAGDAEVSESVQLDAVSSEIFSVDITFSLGTLIFFF